MKLKTRTMEMISFASDGTKETTVKIIKTLKQLGGDDRLNLETNINVKKPYYFISEISGVIHCDDVLPEGYTLSDIDIYTEADVLKLLTDFKNSFGLYRGIQVLDSDIHKWFELIKKK